MTAVRQYPSEYDWRYMTVSNLVSSDKNPAGYLWASAGVILSGICGLCWVAMLTRNHEGDRPGGIRALRFGYICMMFAAVLPRLPWVEKGHELVALLAFAGLCAGVVLLMFQTVERKMRGFAGRARLYAAIAAGAAALPVLLAGLAQAYVHYALPELPWVNLSWRARGVPVYLSFAFWEWVMCVVLSAYIAFLSLAAPAVYSVREGEERP